MSEQQNELQMNEQLLRLSKGWKAYTKDVIDRIIDQLGLTRQRDCLTNALKHTICNSQG